MRLVGKIMVACWISVIFININCAQSTFDSKKDAYKQKMKESRENYIKGWNNEEFSEQELKNQKKNEESILVNGDATDNSEDPNENPTRRIKLWAVVIGVSAYKNQAIPQLNYADDDAQLFARFLASPEGGSIPEERLFLLIDEDANHEAVFSTLKEVFESTGEGDGIIFYFSGHGSPDAFILHDYASNKIYDPTSGTNSVNRNYGKLGHRYLNFLIDNSKAKYKYCVIDACHAASMLETKSKSITELSKLDSFYAELNKENSGSVYILSSKEDEYSYESRNQKYQLRGGYFTYFLMKGIRGEADYNKDRIITVVEAFNYTKLNVLAVTGEKQNPAISGRYSYNMPLGVVLNR